MIVAGVARELRRKPRKHYCCYYQSRCQSVTDCHGSSIAGTHAVCARAPAQDSLACASTRHQAVLAAAARVVSGDCTASSWRRPATSVPTRVARSVERERRLSPPPLPLCRSLLRRRGAHLFPVRGARRHVVARKWREATRVTRRVTWCRQPARDLHGLVAAAGATPLQQLIAGGRRSRCCCCWGSRCLDTDVMRSHAVA